MQNKAQTTFVSNSLNNLSSNKENIKESQR